jgi:hypothetical protein
MPPGSLGTMRRGKAAVVSWSGSRQTWLIGRHPLYGRKSHHMDKNTDLYFNIFLAEQHPAA